MGDTPMACLWLNWQGSGHGHGFATPPVTLEADAGLQHRRKDRHRLETTPRLSTNRKRNRPAGEHITKVHRMRRQFNE